MKKITLLCCCLLVTAITFAQNDFITTWQTTTASESITIPTTGSGYNYAVDWGDGNTSTAQTGGATHIYTAAGTYTVKITGTFPRIYFNNTGDRNKIMTIEQWGTNAWTSMRSAFYGATNLTSTATDAPDLSGVTDMTFMFRSANAFNGNISAWDVSQVTTMEGMFRSATAFNQDISSWNTSKVTNMNSLFMFVPSFNQDISGWDVSQVTNMGSMFYGANAFNQDISSWDVSKVTGMASMFWDAFAFNQDISGWDVSKVTNMASMFRGATAFNQDISGWDVSQVTAMGSMFRSDTAFNQDIGGWNTSKVTNMNSLFMFVPSFNQDISGWDVSQVTNMGSMFGAATSFNQNLGAWDISSVTDMTSMFINVTLSTTNYDNTLIGWNTLSTGETQIPTGITFSGGNSQYCAGEAARTALTTTKTWTITDGGKDLVCGPGFITTWQTTTASESITIPTTGSGYNYAVDWGDGNTSTAQTGNATHTYATAGTYTVKITGTFPRIYFNNTGDRNKIMTIEQWGTNAWTSMESAFFGASNLTSTATDAPDLSGVTNMAFMFALASVFNADISAWNVSNVNNMRAMFQSATAFNQDIGGWNTAAVTNMQQMFFDATAFNQVKRLTNYTTKKLL